MIVFVVLGALWQKVISAGGGTSCEQGRTGLHGGRPSARRPALYRPRQQTRFLSARNDARRLMAAGYAVTGSRCVTVSVAMAAAGIASG